MQLVDVLPPSHYDMPHLPDARSIPLDRLRDRAPNVLDPERPVVVYCSESDCGMSPTAARILNDLGFEPVCDYEGGLAAWLRSGRKGVKEGEAAGA